MTRTKQAAAFFMTAALLSSAFAPAALADNKTKVEKICLTVESDIRAGSSGGEVDVTPTGDNTDLYYVDAVEVVNDDGDDWSKSNPPEVDITLGLEDEEEYAFSGGRRVAHIGVFVKNQLYSQDDSSSAVCFSGVYEFDLVKAGFDGAVQSELEAAGGGSGKWNLHI